MNSKNISPNEEYRKKSVLNNQDILNLATLARDQELIDKITKQKKKQLNDGVTVKTFSKYSDESEYEQNTGITAERDPLSESVMKYQNMKLEKILMDKYKLNKPKEKK